MNVNPAPHARTAPAGAAALEAIAGFAALLRDHGYKVGIAEQQALVQSALALPVTRWQALDPAWRAIACQHPRDWRMWPDLFQRYWFPERTLGSSKVSGQTRAARTLQQVVQQLHDSMAPGGRRGGPPDVALQSEQPADDVPVLPRTQGGATRTDALHDRSLSQWLPQDLAQLERLVERIAQRMRRRLTRRWKDAPHGPRLDLRRTLRASLRTGGVPVAPVWRAVRRERPRLFILVDVSRSMETHAQLFLRIARAFVVTLSARVFVFHTRLAEVTALLRSDSATIQEKVNAVTAGFGGGTRIATSVTDFHAVHARAQLARSARVWVLSDGFDADPAGELADALAQVRARGARITWFHPQPALPHSGALAAVHERGGLVECFLRLNSLRDLESVAGQLR